jgi:hypothetical protein
MFGDCGQLSEAGKRRKFDDALFRAGDGLHIRRSQYARTADRI